jgi:carbonic anhydrase
MLDFNDRFDQDDSGSRWMPQSAEEACQLLVKGNRDYVDTVEAYRKKESPAIPIQARPRASGVEQPDAPSQAPFAAVLGCADARVPTELVFGKGCNELFVVRVAGNVLGQECLGSLRYAISHFGDTLKLLVVLAHGKCGAVSEAVDAYLDPRRYLELAGHHPVRAIVDKILISVRLAAMSIEEVYGTEVLRDLPCRSALIEAAVALNAAWNAYCLKQEFHDRYVDLGVVFGVYDLISRHVRLPLSASDYVTAEEKGLFAPPENAEEFRQLAHRISTGELVQNLLRKPEQAA